MNRTAYIAVILLAVVGPVAPVAAQALVPVPLTPGGSVARLEPVVDGPAPVMAAEAAAADDRERFWFYGDYLLGWTSSERLLPLVTTSRAGTPLARAGVLGDQNTTVLFGSNSLNDRLRSGTSFGLLPTAPPATSATRTIARLRRRITACAPGS